MHIVWSQYFTIVVQRVYTNYDDYHTLHSKYVVIFHIHVATCIIAITKIIATCIQHKGLCM